VGTAAGLVECDDEGMTMMDLHLPDDSVAAAASASVAAAT
jgi:hypothetical protein